MFKITPQLYDKIKHFARFPQTGVSLKQMVMFGKFGLECIEHETKYLYKARSLRQQHFSKQASFCTVRKKEKKRDQISLLLITRGVTYPSCSPSQRTRRASSKSW